MQNRRITLRDMVVATWLACLAYPFTALLIIAPVVFAGGTSAYRLSWVLRAEADARSLARAFAEDRDRLPTLYQGLVWFRARGLTPQVGSLGSDGMIWATRDYDPGALVDGITADYSLVYPGAESAAGPAVAAVDARNARPIFEWEVGDTIGAAARASSWIALASGAFWVGIVLTTARCVRRRRRRSAGRCVGCGYVLEGAPVCPECGRAAVRT